MRETDSSADSEAPSASSCPRCGTRFTCGMRAGLAACWCAALPPLSAIPDAAVGCYCPTCLKAIVAAEGRTG